MRGVSPGDVAGRDLRCLQFGVRDRQRASVVRLATDTPDRAGLARVDRDDLALRRRVGGLEHGFSVEPQVPVAFLDHTVRFAGNNEAVVAEADVQRLAAAPQREQDLIRVRAGDGSDRDRTLKRRDRRTERFGRLDAGRDATRDQRRNDLSVGRDFGRQAQRFEGFEVGVVVDVAVERRRDVRAARVDLLVVERMGVGFGDDADAGPAGVRQHRRSRRWGAERDA